MNTVVRLAEFAQGSAQEVCDDRTEELAGDPASADEAETDAKEPPMVAKGEGGSAKNVPANSGEEEPQLVLEHMRMAEALLFASAEPLDVKTLAASLPDGANVPAILSELQADYEKRGVRLVCVAGKYQFRTAPDLAFLLRKEQPEQRRLSRAAIETLAIVAYHQPVTRAEIEDIRGVAVSKGTLDTLLEVGWVKIRGRRRVPGRPVTYGTTEAFLVQFGLESVSHLPGQDELKAAGFLEALPPSGFDVPSPSEDFAADEDPYDAEGPEELATGGADPHEL
jgi:segregation and condensation protein B